MNAKWIWFLFAAAYASAFVANLGHFWWSWDVGALQILSTILYLTVCVFLFCRNRRNVSCTRWAVWLSALTVAAGVLSLLVRFGGPQVSFLMIPAILLAGVFVTPLYGLMSLLSDSDLCYAAVTALGFVWLLWALYLKRNTVPKT